MLHGDLHTGSIFINDSNIKLLDFEFSFWGPMGFNIGILLANLIFAYIHATAVRNQVVFCTWIKRTIVDIVDNFRKGAIELVKKKGLNGQEVFYEVIQDSFAYMGIEILRRCIGIAGVEDIRSINPQELRCEIERKLIICGKELLLNHKSYDRGEDLLQLFQCYFE